MTEAALKTAAALGDWAEAERIGAELDKDKKPPVATLAAALWYAQQGLYVFPLQPGQKIPYPRTKGCRDATTDPTLIRQWWARWPHANVAIATGHVVDVIDIDGPEGAKSWAKADNLPRILGTVGTPRNGGTHLYVPASGAGNRAAMLPGIDYRGRGGYVVAPPSLNAEGVRYTWRQPLNLTGIRLAVCAVCHQTMRAVEPGQTTHPNCEPAA